jgi:V8-like Glu-specific endopeptidase
MKLNKKTSTIWGSSWHSLRMIIVFGIALSMITISMAQLNIVKANEKDVAVGIINPDYLISDSPYLTLPDDMDETYPPMMPPPQQEIKIMKDPYALEVYSIATQESIIIPYTATDENTVDDVQITDPYEGLLDSGYVPESVITPEGRSQIYSTASYPWRTICKLYMTFPDGAQGGCSGSIIGCSDGHGYHVLTAGHCVYSHDHGGWATSVKVVPGLDETYMPFNYALVTSMRSYTGWTVYADHQHDWAVLTLDRNIGDYTGWMGRMTASTSDPVYTGVLNLGGYPSDKPSGTMWWDADYGRVANTYNHWYYMDTYNGQSGSPVWVYYPSTENRYILTTHAYGVDGSGSNHGTRLDSTKFNYITTWCNADSPPLDKADLIDDGDMYNWFMPSQVRPGHTGFYAYSDVRNIGTASSGGFYVCYYASTNDIISEYDYLIGMDYMSSISPFSKSDSSIAITFPTSVPDGEYYVGWIIDKYGTVNEYDETNNIAYEDSYKVTVDGTGPMVTVIQPNGGEEWEVGTTQSITWMASDGSGVGVYDIDIYYSINGGVTYTAIAYGEANDGSYNWLIPDAPSANCLVKIVATDLVGNEGSDESDASFKIFKKDIPTADANGPYLGTIGIPVTFDCSASHDNDDAKALCCIDYHRWDFDNDGVYDTGWLAFANPTITHTYMTEYHGLVRVEVMDDEDQTDDDTASVDIYPPELEYGDAPENGIAYPSTSTTGAFPTCRSCGPAGWIEHTNFGAYFGPDFDYELDGNAGLCPNCFPPYNQDECFNDGDAGLMVPEPFTLDDFNNVIPCPSGLGTALGSAGQTIVWGPDIDIEVHKHTPMMVVEDDITSHLDDTAGALEKSVGTVRSESEIAEAIVPMIAEIGTISLSIDGLGVHPENHGLIQVEKPVGATVRKAYMAAADVWGSNGGPLPDGAVQINGQNVSWLAHNPTNANSAWSDVTSVVKPLVDASPAGIVHLPINETMLLDGSILAVIFDDPNQLTDNTIVLMFGAQSVLGDTFAIGLSDPINTSDPNLVLDMSLGISFGAQGCNDGQFSEINVNGIRISSCAGGEDDGVCNNSALLTVGGINDSNANPADPYANDNGDPRQDDELYNLIPFVDDGDTFINVTTLNPSGDDNIFFAALYLASTTAVVGEGILLTPLHDINPLGTIHELFAKVQNELGVPIQDRMVNFEVIAGPHMGAVGTDTTNETGIASFSYMGTLIGTDVIEATMMDSQGAMVASNPVEKEWIDDSPETGTYVNVLMDWNQNGQWGDSGEHVLVDFMVPDPYDGPLSMLGPPSFTAGSNPGYVWARFSITERPVGIGWNGSGSFEDGETEDYLLFIEEEPEPVPWLSWYPNAEIPGNQVTMNVTDGVESYFDITLSNVPAGYHVTNGVYHGWCFEKEVQMTREMEHPVRMCHSYDPNKPSAFNNANWTMINYVINTKGTYTPEVIQETIWYYIEGVDPELAESYALIAETDIMGPSYTPEIGDIIAVLLYLDPSVLLPPDYPPVQNTFIEVPLNYTSCPTLFWLDNPDLWPEYLDPDQLAGMYFDVPPIYNLLETYNLSEILAGVSIPVPLSDIYADLLKEAVTGLLNANHSCIHYPITYDQIIVSVNDAMQSSIGSTSILEMILRVYNLIGCDCSNPCCPCCIV